MPKPILISCGEPAGIGTDILLTAWQKTNHIPQLYVGNIEHIKARAKQLNIVIPLSIYGEQNNFHKSLVVYQIKSKVVGKAGKIEQADQKAVLESITTSVKLLGENIGAGLVTLPIHKQALYESGFTHQGHTDFLAKLTKTKTPIMMMANKKLRTVPITIHIALNKVASELKVEKIVTAAKIVADELKKYFAIKNPRLAFAGLNPHGGEGGTMGKEEQEIIIPAIEILKKQNINCQGPFSADTLFHEEALAQYDVAMCMYHDQALVPVKTQDFYGTVNITLGLPIIRTSPDHGTALELAGKGKASDKSFCAALKLAYEMANKKNAN